MGFEDGMAIQEDTWYSLGWRDLGSGDGSDNLIRGKWQRMSGESNKWARK